LLLWTRTGPYENIYFPISYMFAPKTISGKSYFELFYENKRHYAREIRQHTW